MPGKLMNKDKESFLEIVHQNKGIILKICNAYCNAPADRDDLAQEIIYNLWKAFPKYRPDYKISTWIYRIALNVAISYYRKVKRSLQYTAYSEELIVLDTEQNTEKEEQLIKLEQFIQELNEIDRSILLMYLEDNSYKEIAGCLGMSETNVATKINRIKIKLKTKF